MHVFRVSRLTLFLLPIILMLPPGDAFGAADAGPPLTIAQAIEKASRQHPRVEAYGAKVDGARERITQARSGFLPQAYVSEKFDRTNNPMWAFGTKLNQSSITAPDFDPDRLNTPDAIQNFNTVFGVTWPVYDSGRTWHGVRQAEMGETAASLSLDQARRQVIAGAAVAYFGVLIGRENLSVVEMSLKSARAHLKIVGDRYDGGFVVKSDLLRARVRISELEQERFQAESRLAIARAALNAAMGEPIDRRYQLTTPLAAVDKIDLPLERWVAASLERRADYLAMKQQEAIAVEEIRKSRAAHLPSVDLFGNYEINSENWSETADNYTVGAMVRLNLYSGNRDVARTREAQADLKNIQALLRDMEDGIRVQTREAFLQAKSAWDRIRVAGATVSEAEENLRIVSDRYQNGLLTIVVLLDAEVALDHARRNHFQALYDYKTALARLALVTGTIDETFMGEGPCCIN